MSLLELLTPEFIDQYDAIKRKLAEAGVGDMHSLMTHVGSDELYIYLNACIYGNALYKVWDADDKVTALRQIRNCDEWIGKILIIYHTSPNVETFYMRAAKQMIWEVDI